MALGDTTYRGALPLSSIVAVKTVTPSDANDLPDGMCRGFMIGAAGNISIIDAAGNTSTITAPAVGVIHWIACMRVRATGTTATAIQALY
jgi:hypothetical protein